MVFKCFQVYKKHLDSFNVTLLYLYFQNYKKHEKKKMKRILTQNLQCSLQSFINVISFINDLILYLREMLTNALGH